jgi:hypothetical protein
MPLQQRKSGATQKFVIASPKPCEHTKKDSRHSSPDNHFSFNGSGYSSKNMHKRTSIISNTSEASFEERFAEEYRNKQQAIFGELQQLCEEKGGWPPEQEHPARDESPLKSECTEEEAVVTPAD